jgi:hypothetical protein
VHEPVLIGSAYRSRYAPLKDSFSIYRQITGHIRQRVGAIVAVERGALYGHLFISAALGDLDDCFRALSSQAEIHSWPYNVEILPLLREVRKDPRYWEFRKKVGIST